MSAVRQSLPVATRQPIAAVARRIHQPGQGPRHPPGLYIVCLAVLCERWAAYTLASSVVFMLCDRYGYARADALRVAGLVNAASYLGTLPGGLAADRVFGAGRALRISTVLLALGYAMLTFSGSVAFWSSIGLLVLGSSLFKPGTQTAIAGLYGPSDPQLDAAQVMFYLAVNAGAALGALLAGLVVRGSGWSLSYALAAAVMLAGRLVLWVGRDALRLRAAGLHPTHSDTSTSRTMTAWQRCRMIGALTLAMLIYTICFAQAEGSLLLWAQDKTDRVIFGFEIPAAWFAGLPAMLVLMLAPIQLALLSRLQRRIGTQRLIAWGLLAVALAYITFSPAVFGSATRRVSMGWLVGCLTLIVVGELLIGPLGLSLLLRLTPRRFIGVVVGVWYVSNSLGFWLAGEIGALWVRWSSIGVLALLIVLPLSGAWVLWRAAPHAD